MTMKKKIVVGISGASGAIYGVELLKHLLLLDCEVFCTLTDSAKLIMKDELGSDDILKLLPNSNLQNLKLFSNDDFYAPMASGSFIFDAMAVAPCSMKTLGKLANGIADNLLCRAAEVALKERRKLVIVPRETPLALTHIKNMASLVEAGAIMLPPTPAFYQNKTKTLQDMLDFISARIISAMGVKNNILEEWGAK